MAYLTIKICLSIGWAVFLMGLGMVLLRPHLFGKLLGLSMGLKGIFLGAFVLAARVPGAGAYFALVGLIALVLLELGIILGIALGLRSRFRGALLDFNGENNLRH